MWEPVSHYSGCVMGPILTAWDAGAQYLWYLVTLVLCFVSLLILSLLSSQSCTTYLVYHLPIWVLPILCDFVLANTTAWGLNCPPNQHLYCLYLYTVQPCMALSTWELLYSTDQKLVLSILPCCQIPCPGSNFFSLEKSSNQVHTALQFSSDYVTYA